MKNKGSETEVKDAILNELKMGYTQDVSQLEMENKIQNTKGNNFPS